MTTTEKIIARCIRETQEANKAVNPLLYCSISPELVRSVEARLYALPELCERVETAAGIEAVLLNLEISRLKAALSSISNDPYYPLIPAKYFSRATDKTAAVLASCDKSTLWRNRKRLLEALALRLYGVSVWSKTSIL